MPRQIRELIARRSDLGTFLVHLTRDMPGSTARQNLEGILTDRRIIAHTPLGAAVQKLRTAGLSTDLQRCVCFTETPLEHAHLLLGEIELRAIQLAPYGIVIPKKVGRRNGINPVWYVDITPGHTWLMGPVNTLIDEAIASGHFDESSIASLAPFIEQMGTQLGAGGYRKEFWWEREWRRCGDYLLPARVIVMCPEDEIPHFYQFIEHLEFAPRAEFIDPRWGLEQIISSLARFQPD